MKKQKNYALLAVLIVFLMAGIPSFLPSILKPVKAENKIVKVAPTKTDDFVSTINYSEPKQVEVAKEIFSRSCVGPCPNGYCTYANTAGTHCVCCANKPNGYCFLHEPTVPTKPGE